MNNLRRVDYTLVAEAQRCAGAHVHEVAQHLTVYELSTAQLSDVMTDTRADELLAVIARHETWLREFVARHRNGTH